MFLPAFWRTHNTLGDIPAVRTHTESRAEEKNRFMSVFFANAHTYTHTHTLAKIPKSSFSQRKLGSHWKNLYADRLSTYGNLYISQDFNIREASFGKPTPGPGIGKGRFEPGFALA